MPNREDIHLISQYVTDFRKKGVSLPSEIVEVTVAGDNLAPAAPTGLTASAVPSGIKLEWTNPSTNADGTSCVDMRWCNIYWKSSTGVSKSSYDGMATIGAKQGTNAAWTDTNVTTGTTKYYVVTALDTCGNESTESSEVSKAAGGSPPVETDIPDDASGLIFDDTKGTEGVVTGKGILGVAFQSPDTSWVNFDRYRLWYAVDTGGGFGAWIEIKNVGRKGYVHKGLNTGYSYRYKATVLSTDGTESSTPDKAKSDDSGYTPNAADNGSVVAELIFAENIVCTGEVEAEHISVTNLAAINADLGAATAGSFVVGSTNKLWLNDSGDGGLAIGGSTKGSAPFRVAATGALTATNATITGTITCGAGSSYAGSAIGTAYTAAKCTDANADQTSTHTAADTSAINGLASSKVSGWAHASDTTKIDGGDIYTSTITADKLNVSTLSSITANIGTLTAGTLTGLTVRTSSGTTRAEMATGSYPFAYYYGGDRKFYVDTSGNVVAKSFKDSNGEEIVSSGVFQGVRVIEVGYVGGSSAEHTVWSTASRTVPSGKIWVVIVTSTERTFYGTADMNIGELDLMYADFYGRFSYNNAFYLPAGTHSTNLTIRHYWYIERDDGTSWSDNPNALYQVIEVPSALWKGYS